MNKKDHLQDEKKKIVAFTAINEEEYNALDEDELAIMTIKVVDNNRRYINQMRRKLNYSKGKQNNDYNRNEGKCYKCGNYDHIA